MQDVAPVAASERLDVVDVVRGVAVLGILIVNMGLFFGPIYLEMLGGTWFPDPLNVAAEKAIVGFAQGKFITIFAILFGFGLAIQYERFRARERPFPGFWARRMGVLLAFGLVHGILVWFGDILTWYALCGLVLLLFRNCKPRTLKIWAAVLVLFPIVFFGACTACIRGASMLPEVGEQIEKDQVAQRETFETLAEQARERYPEAGFAETVGLNARQWSQVLVWVVFQFPFIVGMFVIGLLYGRYRLFHEGRERLPWFRRQLRWLFPVAVLTNGLAAYLAGSFDNMLPSGRSFLFMALLTVGQLAGCTTYVFATILAYHSPRTHRLVAPLGAVGRMALTNYLTHSIVFTTLANGYGFALYGKVSPSAGLLMTLVMFVVQVALSNLWLSRFRFGPMEWLWRSLTYGRLQPMRRDGT